MESLTMHRRVFQESDLNYSFAGAFNSRLNLNLREEKGFTYGVRGGFSGSKFAGPFIFQEVFRANATDSTLLRS